MNKKFLGVHSTRFSRFVGITIVALALIPPVISAEETAADVLLSPSPNPPPPQAEQQRTLDQRLVLDATYDRQKDSKGLFERFDDTARCISEMQARVHETNRFLAKLHNYSSKVAWWWDHDHNDLYEALGDFIGRRMDSTNAPATQVRYIRALLVPVCGLELLDDPQLADLVLESERIKLNPPFPATPPITYAQDGLLHFPSATNVSLRLPADPPPCREAIRQEMVRRVEIARGAILANLKESDLPLPVAKAIKASLKQALVVDMTSVCQEALSPRDLKEKLQEAAWLKSRLPRDLSQRPGAGR